MKIFLLMIGLVLLPILMISRGLASPPGILDASFNGSGVAITHFWTSAFATSVAIQSDGKIVVAGYTFSGGSNRFALARYATNGVLDTTFGPDANGTITTIIGTSAFAQAVAVQSDGGIVVAGRADVSGVAQFALTRYDSRGILDRSFGSSGVQTTLIGSGAVVNGIAIQGDDKIVAVGDASVRGAGYFALARYTSNGDLDTTFNSGGSQPGVVTTLKETGAYASGWRFSVTVR